MMLQVATHLCCCSCCVAVNQYSLQVSVCAPRQLAKPLRTAFPKLALALLLPQQLSSALAKAFRLHVQQS
jgi:hypothetical protein